jgi:superfamily II RNA helicase
MRNASADDEETFRRFVGSSSRMIFAAARASRRGLSSTGAAITMLGFKEIDQKCP